MTHKTLEKLKALIFSKPLDIETKQTVLRNKLISNSP